MSDLSERSAWPICKGWESVDWVDTLYEYLWDAQMICRSCSRVMDHFLTSDLKCVNCDVSNQKVWEFFIYSLYLFRSSVHSFHVSCWPDHTFPKTVQGWLTESHVICSSQVGIWLSKTGNPLLYYKCMTHSFPTWTPSWPGIRFSDGHIRPGMWTCSCGSVLRERS